MTTAVETSPIRRYLETMLEHEGRGGWTRRKPYVTSPLILELVREYKATTTRPNNDEAERFLEERIGDMPEHYHHGHDNRHELTYQLGSEIYIAGQILDDEAARLRLIDLLDQGFRPLDTSELVEGQKYTVRSGVRYGGRDVPDYSRKDIPARAVMAHTGRWAFLPKGKRTHGFMAESPMLIREGWA